MLKTDVYHQSLRTKDFEKAKIRLRYVLSWIADLEMKNTSEMDDYKLYRHNWTGNARTIADYLKDEWPVDEERLWQRGNFEIMVNNYKRKMQISSGFSPNEFVPGFSDQFLKFIKMQYGSPHKPSFLQQ
ncbi:hypothetical protein [Ahrensia sp. 13_GOM-1096m]|uniref:hypothetical protein n=1 Tax=Ahrensia sp. 13_GOM-1096m TaxID=1380380 RepID=UPI00047B7CF6|nr:hypothetical protein [Ahrensia sp. 13_GOM-1096m]